jgi:hypothetical protein
MDAGSRNGEVALWRRAAAVWMLIILAETVHGFLRELLLAPAVGALPARQIGVPVGCVIIFAIAWGAARWIGASGRRQWLAIGSLWVALTVVFEISLGVAIGASWTRILSDYNPARGGFMLFGLAFMGIAPWLAARMRR